MSGAGLDKQEAVAYRLPAHLTDRLDELSWENIIELSGSFSARHKDKRPETAKLHKEISMARILLMEKAQEQSHRQSLDPAVLVDLIRLLRKCEKLAIDYEMDLDEFNHFLYLLITKAKREKLARHEGLANWRMKFRPMDKEELEGFKKRSEKGRRE